MNCEKYNFIIPLIVGVLCCFYDYNRLNKWRQEEDMKWRQEEDMKLRQEEDMKLRQEEDMNLRQKEYTKIQEEINNLKLLNVENQENQEDKLKNEIDIALYHLFNDFKLNHPNGVNANGAVRNFYRNIQSVSISLSSSDDERGEKLNIQEKINIARQIIEDECAIFNAVPIIICNRIYIEITGKHKNSDRMLIDHSDKMLIDPSKTYGEPSHSFTVNEKKTLLNQDKQNKITETNIREKNRIKKRNDYLIDNFNNEPIHQSGLMCFDKDENINERNETKYKCVVERERNKRDCYNKSYLFDSDGNIIETMYKCVVDEDKCYEDKCYDEFERNKRFNDKCYKECERNKMFNDKCYEECKRVKCYKHQRFYKDLDRNITPFFVNGNINGKYKCVISENNNYKEYAILGFRRFIFNSNTT